MWTEAMSLNVVIREWKSNLHAADLFHGETPFSEGKKIGL